MKKSRLLAILVAALLGNHPAAHADIWVGTFNSDWFFTGNWNLFDGPPGVGDTASLPSDSDGVFPVTRTQIDLSASTTIARLNADSPLNAQYTLTGSNGAKLTATIAADFKNPDLQALNVHTLSNLGLNTPLVRVFDNAILALDNGSIVTTNDLQIAKIGRVDVNNGSSVQTLSYRLDDAAGEVRVNSGGELRIAGDTTILRGTTTINSGGQLNALSGVDLEYNGTALLQFASGHSVDDDVHLKATGGGDITGSSFIDVGNNRVGSLTVTGAGSTLTAGSSFSDWGISSAGKATVTITDSAVATASSLRVGTGGGQFIGSVSGGAELKTLSTFLMGGGSTVRQVSLDINGNGAFQTAGSATFDNAADLNLTNGTVNFNSGAAFNAGSRMDWSGGTVNLGANSTLLINGGVINKTSTSGFIFGGNTTTRIQAGGTFTTLSYFDVGDAKLEVDNATLTVGTLGGTVSDWGASSSSVITLSSNALATYNSGLRMSFSSGTTNATVSSGARLVTTSLSTGGAAASNATLSVNNGRVESSGAIDLLRGTTVNVTGGGKIEGENVSLGSTGGPNGVTVTGENSLLKARQALVVGQSGDSTLTVSAGGQAVSNSETILGKQAGSHGTLNVTGSGSTLSVGTKLTVGDEGAGTLNVTNSAYVPVIGSVVINGSSTVNVNSGGKLQISPTSSISNDGEIFVTDGGIIEAAISNFWRLQLSSSNVVGHVTLFDGSQLLAEASSVSSLDQQAGAEIYFELGGAGGATRLSSTGATGLDGRLVLNLIDEHLPTLGQSYSLIQAGGITGFFRTIGGLVAPNGLYLAVIPTATTIEARAVKGGDASLDGQVDGVDYTVWADNFLTNDRAYYTKGDFNGDGRTDGADYIVWADHFAPALALSVAAVPEPNSIWLAAIGLLCIAARHVLTHARDVRSTE